MEGRSPADGVRCRTVDGRRSSTIRRAGASDGGVVVPGTSLASVVGVVLLLLGASGASAVHRRQQGRPGPVALLTLAPFGVLIGAGAALVRGWDLGLAAVTGALVVIVVALAGDVLAARRRARDRRASAG